MALSEEIKKELAEKGVDSATIGKLDMSSEVERLTSELAAEKGKVAGITEDKRKFKERMEKAESKISEMESANLTGDEKRQKEINDAKAAVEELKKQIADKDAAVAKEKREAGIAKITGEMKFIEGFTSSAANSLVKNALAEIDDLNDAEKVSAAITAFKDQNKGLFAANVAAGSGSNHRNQAGSGGDGKPVSIEEAMKAKWSK